MEIKDILSSGLLELHALGMTNQSETAQVEQWMKKFPDVKYELGEIEKCIEMYATTHAITPPAELKQKIATKINTPATATNRSDIVKVLPITSFWKFAAAASIILLMGSAILNYVYYNKLEDASAVLENTQQELTAASDKLNDINTDMSIVQNKFSKSVSLDGLPAAPDAAAKIFWMKNTGEVYIDPSNLPEAPAGKQYQLWAIVDGKPVDGGMIITSKKDNKYRIQKMKTFGKAEAFAVTLETAGGNPAPMGEMYVMGKM